MVQPVSHSQRALLGVAVYSAAGPSYSARRLLSRIDDDPGDSCAWAELVMVVARAAEELNEELREELRSVRASLASREEEAPLAEPQDTKATFRAIRAHRPTLSPDSIAAAIAEREAGATLEAVAAMLNRRGERTTMGHYLTEAHVRRLLKREKRHDLSGSVAARRKLDASTD